MNKLGINLWNWAPGLSDACCGLPTKAAEMGFTALELPMTQPAVSPTLRDEVRGSGLEVSLCAALGAGRDLSSFDADVRAATMQYLTDCLQTGAALGAVVLAGPLYAGGGKRHTLPPAEAAREWELAVTGLQELARRKKVAVILSIHELDLAERVSDWVLCVSPGQESRFGRPEEMLTPEHLSELFQIEEGRFRQTGGSMELPRPEGAPEVFVLAGGGSGRAVFWQLQRAGTTFAAGIVSEADLDYPAACTLASRLIAVPAFEEISEEKEQEARECLDACQCVIACRRQYGGWAAANDRLLAYAREKGKKIEYHNLPLHKMQ